MFLSQLQNEFIQQRCLNFRLVPVLFPNATRVSTQCSMSVTQDIHQQCVGDSPSFHLWTAGHLSLSSDSSDSSVSCLLVFQDHIPIWLKSTRIYRWPQDTQDLLLRLLREERYIAPPMGKELTLTIRPI